MRSAHIIIFVVLVWLASSYQSWTDVTSIINQPVAYSVYTGYIQVNTTQNKCTDNGMFFEYATKDGQPTFDKLNKNSPVLIWLNGGPGSSSQLGSWSEVGPFYVTDAQQVAERQFRWNRLAHLIFIDQPISNVGLSFCKGQENMINNTYRAGVQFLQFIQKMFTQTNMKALKDNPIYILGESYGGHYAPYFTNLILQSTKVSLNIRSLAVADGWVNPPTQMMSYHSMMAASGIMSAAQSAKLQRQQGMAASQVLREDYAAAKDTFDLMTDTNNYDVSVYNFLQPPDGIENHQIWINQNKAKYGIPSWVTFQGGNERVYDAFAADITLSYSVWVQSLLKVMKVVIYNGQLDLIVNTPAAYNFVNQLNWNKLSQWQKTKKQVWTQGDKIFGTAKDFDNLAFVVIYGAGHMVPTDQPQAAFSLVSHFLAMDNDWHL